MATTTLTITPNFAKKTAKFRGTIAAGEHVAVSIQNDDTYVGSVAHLRLRVVDPSNGKTLAIFPQPDTEDAWDSSDLTPLTPAQGGSLNLNTVQMLQAVPPAATVPLLFVLDDKEADTLYFKDFCDVTHWPQVQGEDEPYNLDEYPDIVAELQEDWADFQQTVNGQIETIGATAASAVTKANAAKAVADSAGLAASSAVTKANEAKAVADAAKNKVDSVVDGKADLVDGKVPDRELPTYVNAAVYDSQAKKIYLKHGDDVVAEVDATAFIKDGMVSSVAVSGGNLVITFNTEAGKEPISIPLTDIFDPSNYYDKTAADARFASAAEATLTKRGPNHDGFTAWSFSDGNSYTIEVFYEEMPDPNTPWKVGVRGAYGNELYATEEEANYALANTLTLINFYPLDGHTTVSATRTALPGYDLGSQTDKPLVSEAEAEELREKKYEKPSGGIPKTDLASGVQTSLGKADTAVQPEAGKGLFSGSYTDLTNRPPLGSAAAKDVPASGDASSTQVVMGDDTRLSDSRTPTAHKSTHASGGTDPLSPSDIGAQPTLGYTAENSANKVTSISSSSTDTQYPSAKCVFDIVGNIESALQIINTGSAS